MEGVMNLTYESSLTNLCEINSSFDTGVLRVAYSGANRNGSFISKETFEKCINTMYNCPIVCHYDRESDSLGGHDIEIVSDNDGEAKIVNLTTPVGVIPESAKYWWDDVTEEDGSIHEYLYVEVLLWKRQEAYQKIKEDGITAHSMEISVRNGKFVDDFYHITSFEFTAFALIGVEPCFESSALMFSTDEFKQQFNEMMREIKDMSTQVNISKETDNENINPHNFTSEGGETVLKDEINEVVEEVIEEVVDVVEEQPEVAEEIENAEEVVEEPSDFALTGNAVEEIRRVLEEDKIASEWGYEYPRYLFVDTDLEKNEVYCYGSEDWLLYGFSYAMNGDAVSIDFDSKKRMKYDIVEFDEGEQASPFADIFSVMTEKIKSNMDAEEHYNEAAKELEELKASVEDLKNTVRAYECEKVFAEFEDLNGIDEFEALRSTNEFEADVVREKCYAIRGRNMKNEKFSNSGKQPKLSVNDNNFDRKDNSEKPYGGLVEEYEGKYND